MPDWQDLDVVQNIPQHFTTVMGFFVLCCSSWHQTVMETGMYFAVSAGMSVLL